MTLGAVFAQAAPQQPAPASQQAAPLADPPAQQPAPPPATPLTPAQQRALGRQLFASSGCVQCHGPAGQGTPRGPALTQTYRRRTPDYLHIQIHDGGGAMPPFGEALTAPEIDALVAFLHTRHTPADWAVPATSPQPAAR